MSTHPSAGMRPTAAMLADIPQLITAYFDLRPDSHDPAQCVAFGTSGHRGSSLRGSFNEAHILAITYAICVYRKRRGINGPLFLGMDTHALSVPACVTALEVLANNQVETMIAPDNGYTPTPAISHAILTYNRGRTTGLADGIVVTPSHNPPEDGGIKYNPPHGGPSETAVSHAIEAIANEFLPIATDQIGRLAIEQARRASTTHLHDYIGAYVADLAQVLDMDAIRDAGVRVGVDPLGGAGVGYWDPIVERYGLQLEVVNRNIDSTFRFMPLDWDGRIRMDCSSRYAMANLIALRGDFDVAFGNDTDHDRHGIVTPAAGLMNPNHYLAVAIDYLLTHRAQWSTTPAIGKTMVSSSLIDRVVAARGRMLMEVPVGFKWFVAGLHAGKLGFAGEESAGASFLRRDGTVWTTDKDGMLLGLLAAEMRAVTGRDPGELYQELTRQHGTPCYERTDAPATREQKARLGRIKPQQVHRASFAGEKIERILTHAPGDGNPLGGIKVMTQNGWFAARPSGTEDVYKIYAESFLGMEHLQRVQWEAQALVDDVLGA